MFENDVDAFMDLLEDAFCLNPNWKPLAPKGKALFFKALEPYPLEAVRRAMTAHIRDPQRGKFQPAPADLIAQIQAAAGTDGRPGADEAWASSLAAHDERETVVWTEEMRDAYAICRPLIERGDEVAARMAFKDAYSRLIAEASRAAKPTKWELSLGQDPQKRTIAIERAAGVGRLSASHVKALLPAPLKPQSLQLSSPEQQGDASGENVSSEGLARLKAELAKLQLGSERAKQKREAERQAQRDAEAQRKRDIDLQVVAYAEVSDQSERK